MRAVFFGFLDTRTSLIFVLCCGGDFAATSTACSKRDHASGYCSTSFFESGFPMAKKPIDIRRIRKALGEHIGNYHRALGAFVTAFSRVEATLLRSLMDIGSP